MALIFVQVDFNTSWFLFKFILYSTVYEFILIRVGFALAKVL